MPQGKPLAVPDDGLTTRQRRNRALIVVHTGEMKGKSTAAFGLALRAWNQGWPIGVFQFVKSAKWKIGEESALRALSLVHEQTGEGGPVTWHKMGEGWSWIARPGTEADHAANAREGWEQVKRDLAAQTYGFYVLDEFTYPMQVGLGRRRRRRRHAGRPPRPAACRDHRPRRRPATGRGGRSRDGDDQGQASDGRWPEGPERHRVVNIPRLVVAAPASGHGKTTVATGLMAALTARAWRCRGTRSARTTSTPATMRSRPGARPATWTRCSAARTGSRRCSRTARPAPTSRSSRGSWGCSTGVVPRRRGRPRTSRGLLSAPVVLVVDASAQGRSVAALVHGFASFDPAVRLAGVILNRVGSARHEQILRDALAGIGMPVLGALPRDQAITAPSRHLGLVPAAEREGAARREIARLAALVTESVDLDAVISLARQAGPLSTTPWDPATELADSSPASVIMTSVSSQRHQSRDHDRGAGGGARGAGGGAGRPWWRSRAGLRSRSATPKRWNC